jgi:VIT1/CCC1 family predicted Fe2+/Mn2+ transporter
MNLSAEVKANILKAQVNELTEYYVYSNIAKTLPDDANRKVMMQIAEDELRHSQKWESITGVKVAPKRLMVAFYTTVSRLFGFTFGIKLMEKGEEAAQVNYGLIAKNVPDAVEIMKDEQAHEEQLMAMLDEERLRYAGSVVLGLNDALVELTGALAGLTLAMQGNVKLIALSGLITGIAASLSMSASEYLSTSQEDGGKHPVRAALYTGLAYVLTVALLITPYLVLDNAYTALAISLTTGVLIIAVFNYYISVAKDESFKKRFSEMAILSLSVAAFSFVIGYFIRIWLGVEL